VPPPEVPGFVPDEPPVLLPGRVFAKDQPFGSRKTTVVEPRREIGSSTSAEAPENGR
jgi:hypothetical protein